MVDMARPQTRRELELGELGELGGWVVGSWSQVDLAASQVSVRYIAVQANLPHTRQAWSAGLQVCRSARNPGTQRTERTKRSRMFKSGGSIVNYPLSLPRGHNP